MNRILYCETNLDGTVGGSYFSLYFLVTRLDRTKYTPIVIFHRMNPVAERMQESGIDVRIIRPGISVSGIKWIRLMRLTALINSITAILLPALRFRAFLKRNSISLVHINNGLDTNYPVILAANLASVPCVVHQRGGIADDGLPFHIFRKLVDKVICVSKSVARDTAAKRIPPSKISTIYNGIDPNLTLTRSREEVRRSLGISDTSPLVGISGTIRFWKGQDVVVKAIHLLKKTFPNITCLIIGDSPKDQAEYEGKLHGLIEELAISNNVRFLGHQDRVFDFINAIDVPIHASTVPEPFGRVIIEAMSLEKPIVASRAGGVTEIVVEGETGLMFTPGDANELAACVAKLLENPDLARTMGRNGKLRVKEFFHADQTVKQVMALYREILPVAGAASTENGA